MKSYDPLLERVTRVNETTRLRAAFIYEAARYEALLSRRPIVPEPLDQRDPAFILQFYATVERICADGYVTTPTAEHASWVRAYEAMGWKYGPIRDPVAKLHPDMVPFEELPRLEREKDEVFLDLCAFARKWIH